MHTDILIVGGGLAGLALADHCNRHGRDFHLLDARPRLGGRIGTNTLQGAAFDMGPTWYWPGQPRIAALVARLKLGRFDQYAEGDLCFEDETGQVQRGRGYASMAGSFRLEGGMQALITALAAPLPPACIQLGAPAVRLRQAESGVRVDLADGSKITAQHAILAMPPRLAAQNIAFDPPLPDQTLTAMRDIPTWMAGQAKAVAVYDRPFWRKAGLSGDAMSQIGPMAEIHDASSRNGGPYGLFGFIGVPPSVRADETAMRGQLLVQLSRLFGPEAGVPLALFVKDWATDGFTATKLDHTPLTVHPPYGLPEVMANLWEGALHFAGTETAADFGGYLEGALEAAEKTALILSD